MGVGRACGILLPIFFSVVTIVLELVSFLGSYETLGGLRDVYFLKIDLSGLNVSGINLSSAVSSLGLYQIYQVGANGYCYGSKNGSGVDLVGCKTPTTPFWFDFIGIVEGTSVGSLLKSQLPSEISEYETILKAGSYAIWSCLIAAMCLSFLAIVSGFFSFHSRLGSCCSMILAVLATLTSIVAAGVATGLYRVYGQKFNDSASEFGASASIGSTAMVLIWVGAAVSVAASVFWSLSICCGSTARRTRVVNSEDKEPFIGYNAYEH